MKTWNAVKVAKTGYIVTSILFCAGGLLLFLYPSTAVTVLCYTGGGLFILGGLVKLAGYFSRDLYRLAFQFDLAYGLLLVALGLVMMLHPQGVIAVLHFLIGVVILSDGLIKVQTALDARRFGIRTWWLIAVAAAVTGMFGLLLIINPFRGAAVLTAVMGIGLLAEGLLNLCVAACAVKTIQSREPDIVDI